MKLKITLLFAIFTMLATPMFAGFPVTRAVDASVTSTTISEGETAIALTSPAAVEDDKFLIAILLFVFLWPLAAHRWYLGSPIGWNILFILTIGGLGIWALIDLIDILTKKYPGL